MKRIIVLVFVFCLIPIAAGKKKSSQVNGPKVLQSTLSRQDALTIFDALRIPYAANDDKKNITIEKGQVNNVEYTSDNILKALQSLSKNPINNLGDTPLSIVFEDNSTPKNIFEISLAKNNDVVVKLLFNQALLSEHKIFENATAENNIAAGGALAAPLNNNPYFNDLKDINFNVQMNNQPSLIANNEILQEKNNQIVSDKIGWDPEEKKMYMGSGRKSRTADEVSKFFLKLMTVGRVNTKGPFEGFRLSILEKSPDENGLPIIKLAKESTIINPVNRRQQQVVEYMQLEEDDLCTLLQQYNEAFIDLLLVNNQNPQDLYNNTRFFQKMYVTN